MRVGITVLHDYWAPMAPEARRRLLADIAAGGMGHVNVADHVSFGGGGGFDGMVSAASVLATHDTLGVHIGVYLLALRHPVPVARQIVTLADLYPGRLSFGVGVGGDDRAEVEACGVDPATRGRRTDESLGILRALLAGDTVSSPGPFFPLSDVAVLPPPDPPVPILVGGRSAAALRRAGRMGDGWLAIWVSPDRFAAGVATVAAEAGAAGRTVERWDHGLNLWCGVGPSREEARAHVAGAMEALYRTPFSAFERWCPSGTPEEVAAFLAPYLEAGCTTVNLVPRAESPEAAVAGAAEIVSWLRKQR